MPNSLFNRIAWQGPVCVSVCGCDVGGAPGPSFNKIAGTVLIVFSPGTVLSAGHHVSLLCLYIFLTHIFFLFFFYFSESKGTVHCLQIFFFPWYIGIVPIRGKDQARTHISVCMWVWLWKTEKLLKSYHTRGRAVLLNIITASRRHEATGQVTKIIIPVMIFSTTSSVMWLQRFLFFFHDHTHKHRYVSPSDPLSLPLFWYSL